MEIVDGRPTISDVTVNLGTDEIVVGSINRDSGTLSIEIGGTAEVSVTSTTITLGGNLVLPSTANIGPSGDTDLLGLATGALTVNGSVGVGVNPPSTDLHLYNTTTSRPVLLIHNYNTDAEGPAITLLKDSVGSAADLDINGYINFDGYNDAGTPEYLRYAQLIAYTRDVSDGAESGALKYVAKMNGTNRNLLWISGYNGTAGQGEFTVNEDGQDIDTRFEVSGNANALVIDGADLGIGIGTATFDSTGRKTLNIANGTEPAAHVDDQTILYSKDSAAGGATLGIYTEAAVAVIGTFTPSHKLPVWINGTEYHIQLDAV